MAVTLPGCRKTATESSPHKKAESEVATVQPEAKATVDGPLGIAAGMSIADLQGMDFIPNKSTPSMFSGRPPKPMEDSAEYYIFATPKSGVCRIVAATAVSPVNGSGDQVRAKVDQLAEIVEKKYGKHTAKVNSAREDFYRKHPQIWLTGLKKDSVSYGYAWQASKMPTALPSRISSIELNARATSEAGAFVELQYTFTNFDKCLEEDQLRQSSNL